MKKFLIKTTLYVLLFFSITSFILLKYGGYVDYFYEKFTTPKAKSMIIGGSRSMQGIQPQIIDEELKELDFEKPVFNYSFTVAQAPIGPPYIKSIFRKLDPQTKNGIFIISITPWMLSSNKEDDKNNIFKEAESPPHNMVNVTMNPNYEYLVKNLTYFHFKGIFRKNSKMHKNGWLEENNFSKDSQTFIEWKQIQKKMLLRFSNDNVISEDRRRSFNTLLESLQKHGKVFIIRTPIDKDFLEIETNFFPEFDNFIKKSCSKFGINYFNYNINNINTNYKTYDGHHIDKHGGVYFTKSICDSIKKVM